MAVAREEDDPAFDVSLEEDNVPLAAIAQADRGEVVSWEELRKRRRFG